MLDEMFNYQYINIVEKTSGKKHLEKSHFPRDNEISDTIQAIDAIAQ